MTTKTVVIPSSWLDGIDLDETNFRRALLLGVIQLRQKQNAQVNDPVIEILGAYSSSQSLIDGIPVSEDPDLYLLSTTFGEQSHFLHAWEMSPQRYTRGENGQAIRRN